MEGYYTLIIVYLIVKFCIANDCNSTECVCGQPLGQNSGFTLGRDNILLEYESKQCSYHVQCHDKHLINHISSDLYPQTGNLKLNLFKLVDCTLPDNTTIKHLMDQLKIGTTKELNIRRSDMTNIPSDFFSGIDNLEYLILKNNFVNKLPFDLLYTLSKLKTLNMEENKVEIPQAFFRKSNLTQLIISNNYLPEYTIGMFGNLKHLIRLEMYKMEIKKLQENIFENLTQLHLLELGRNKIESLPKNIFKDLYNLRTLALTNNNISYMNENVFVNNKNLNILRLTKSFNENLILSEKVLWSLEQLNTLDLNSNHITTLPTQIFAKLTMLKTLDLSNNQLRILPKDIFKNLRSLTVLNLKYNQLESLPLQTFSNLKNLSTLILSKNRIKLHHNIFYGLNALKTLDLSYNNLTIINPNVFDDVVDLENLILSSNNLSFPVSLISPFSVFVKLKNLKLNNNNINTVFNDWKIYFHSLKSLDLSYNNFTILESSDFNFLQEGIKINLEHNHIYHIRPQQFNSNKMEINLNYNPLHCGCNLFYLYQYYNNLKRSDSPIKLISDNLKCQTPKNMNGLPVKNIELETFTCDLVDEKHNYNVCPKNTHCYFRPFTKTLIVDGSFRESDTTPELNIKTTPQLYYTNTSEINIILNMSGNNLRNFYNQNDEVTILDLSKNKISLIEMLPTNLEVLYLHANNLTNLNSTQLIMLNTTNFKNTTLYDNPWSCDCDLIDFTNYLQENYHKVISPLSIKCAKTNVILLNLSIEDLCPSQRKLIVAASITIAFLSIITAIAIGVFYYYNIEIKVWLYAHNLFLWFITEDELDKDKIYDAFISYSHKDEDFIINEILPKLEESEKPYKLCLHFRNWQPGELITTNITRSISESCRTMVILSPNFLESEWGKMEFRTAHVQALNEGRVRVIVILLGEIPINELDNELKAYLNTNTYVKWGDPWFWDKLRYALPHDRKFCNKNLSMNVMKSNDKLDLINNSNLDINSIDSDCISKVEKK